MKLFSRLCITFFLLYAPIPLQAAETPMVTIEIAVSQVMKVLNDPALEGDNHKIEKHNKIWKVVDDAFDYNRLSRQALGKNWSRITPAEQKEFTHLFSRFLGQVYIDKLTAFSVSNVSYVKQIQLSDTVSEVRTEVKTSDTVVPISYRLSLNEGDWRIYDVIVEGVSLLNNYRSQFRNILAKKSMADLLVQLRKKVS